MRPLETNRRVLIWLCLCFELETLSKFKKSLSILLTSIVMASIIGALISSALYLWKFILIDLQGSVYALYQTAGFFSILYAFVVMFISRQKIHDIFCNLERIYGTSMYQFWRTFWKNFLTIFFFLIFGRIECNSRRNRRSISNFDASK